MQKPKSNKRLIRTIQSSNPSSPISGVNKQNSVNLEEKKAARRRREAEAKKRRRQQETQEERQKRLALHAERMRKSRQANK